MEAVELYYTYNKYLEQGKHASNRSRKNHNDK